MPDQTFRGRPTRAVVVTEVSRPPCPKCGRWLRVTAGEGAVLLTCNARISGVRCDQRIALVGLSGRVCLVVPLTVPEFEQLRLVELVPAGVLERLGLLSVPLLAAS